MTLVATLAALLSRRVHAAEGVLVAIEVATEGDEERTSLLDEPTDPGHGDEAVGELSQGLREPGLHVLRLLPLHAKSTLGEPVEISRRRTPRLLKRYFMMPMGNERYCLIDPEGPIELKGEWTQQDHSVCVAVVSFVGGFVSLAIVEVATGGVGSPGAGGGV